MCNKNSYLKLKPNKKLLTYTHTHIQTQTQAVIQQTNKTPENREEKVHECEEYII